MSLTEVDGLRRKIVTEPQEQVTGGIGKYLVVYLAILILAGLQFVIAYQHIDGAQMFARMFLIALAEAGLALMFFMHLWEEKRASVSGAPTSSTRPVAGR